MHLETFSTWRDEKCIYSCNLNDFRDFNCDALFYFILGQGAEGGEGSRVGRGVQVLKVFLIKIRVSKVCEV